MPNHEELTKKAIEEADAENKDTKATDPTTGEAKVEENKEPTDKTETPEVKKEEVELTEEEKEAAKKKEEELKLEVEKKDIEIKAEAKGKKEGKEIEKTKTEESTKQAWYETPEKKEEVLTPEADKDAQTKVAEYDKLISDPEIKAFIEARKGGKTLRDFVSELKGVDPATLSPKQLFEIQLKTYNLSTEDYEEELEKFNEMSKVVQVNTVKPIKDELLKEQDERFSKFSAETSEEVKREAERTKIITEKANTDLDNYIKEITGKELKGVMITPEIAEGLRSFTDKEFNIYNADGTFNIPYIVGLGLFSKYPDKLMKENIEKATEKGKEEILDKVTRPSTENTASTQRMPDLVKAAEEDVKAAEEQAKRMNPNFTKNNIPVPTN